MTWQADLAARARSAMPAPMWEYTETGALEGVTAAEAEAAWAAVRLWPRVLHDVTDVDISTSLLGTPVSTPVAVAPTSLQRVAHADGERAMTRGADAAGALHVVSSNAGTRFADLGAERPWWLQAYVPPEREELLPVLADAAAAGARAVVVTADTPVPGTKHRPAEHDWDQIDLSWFRCNFAGTREVRWAADLTPDDVGWLRQAAGLPVVVKGVLRADDARRCVDAGAAAVWVSNHGGRQLDRSVATREALPAVAQEVGGDVEVYVDGGIRGGLDVLAALALGADAAFLGRLPLHGLAAGGADGVADVLGRVSAELVDAMRIGGCAGLGDTRELVARERPSGP